MVELSGIINTDFMSKCQGTCKILVSAGCYCFAVVKSKKEHGRHILNEHKFKFPLIIFQDIDSEKPIMQVGQYWFAGEYEGRN